MFLRPIAVLVLPIIVFLSGGWLMSEMSNRKLSQDQLSKAAAIVDQRPLNLRLGYDGGAVSRHWGALEDTGRDAERRFLKLDIIFPVFYGAAFLISMIVAWRTIGRPFLPVWLIAPVVITVVADWIENIVQLIQLRRFIDGGEAALQAGWIHLSSVATVIKLAFFVGSSIVLLALVIVMVIRAFKPVAVLDA